MEVLARLENQGEKESNKMPIWKHWKDGICGNGEGKPIYLIKSGNTYSLSSCLCFECDYIKLSELDKLLSEQQGEKFTDEMIEALRTEYEKGRADAITEMQEPAWSEEDERIYTSIIYAFEHNYPLNEIQQEFVKSLRPQNIWKPTKEQLRELRCVISGCSFETPILVELEEQLKNLS